MSFKTDLKIEKHVWDKAQLTVKYNMLQEAIPSMIKVLEFSAREIPREKEPYMPMPPAQVLISTEFTIITPQSRESILELLRGLQNKLPLSAIVDYQDISNQIKALL